MVHQLRVARWDALTSHPWDADVTEIIPVHEFGELADATLRCSGPFITDVEVLTAPELDDLNDRADESPWVLVAPTGPTRASRPTSPPAGDDSSTVGTEVAMHGPAAPSSTRPARSPAHRQNPSATGAAHSRLLIAAIAAGAVAAAANAAVDSSQARTAPLLLAETTPSQENPTKEPEIQIITVANTFDPAVHRQELSNGIAFAQERAQREARMMRPQFAFPARGILTSGFGTRWGTLHAGLDIANSVGTPIYAAADGEVIASGPTPGYGMWVKIRGADGTVTLYGHIDTATVQTGERVMAGDQIATMGNRGNSTGPHLHFEVHRDGAEKTDPMTWLRERGVPGD